MRGNDSKNGDCKSGDGVRSPVIGRIQTSLKVFGSVVE
jgi:hypothetical protein